MIKSKKLFIDLDRTLLDTDVFIASIWHYIGKKYGVDVEAEKIRSKQYYSYEGEMYDYDFFTHLESLKLGNLETVVFDLTLHMREQFLLFNDTEDGLRTIDELSYFTILTYGNERYQRFKVSCAPELAKYPLVIVQQHKKHYFADQCPEPSILVDDKDLAAELPKNVEFIRIDRTQPLPVMSHTGYSSIRKLRNIKEALHI